MDIVEKITQSLTAAVTDAGFFLEDVTVTSLGKRRVVTCVVDGEVSLNLDEVTLVSKQISEILDEAAFMGETPFTLEVTSPGIDRPLTQVRHWRKNLTRLVKATMVNGEVISGRIDAVHDESVCVLVPVKKELHKVEVPYLEIKRAIVEIEFNRKGDDL
jgi:ribosome maturation factor RimP